VEGKKDDTSTLEVTRPSAEFPDSCGWGQFGGFHPTNAFGNYYSAVVLQDVEALEQEERELLEEYMKLEYGGLTLQGRNKLAGMREIVSKVQFSADDIIFHACDVPGRNPRTRQAVDMSAMVTARCEALKVRLQSLDVRLHDTLLQAQDMTVQNQRHSEAQQAYADMSSEIERIMQAHHARKQASSKWFAVDYVEREDSLKKHAAVLQLWQDQYLSQGTLPAHADVHGLWAKIMSVEVLGAEDRKLKNDLMYGPNGCQEFYERT